LGNEKLIKSEKERKSLLLDNIFESIAKQIQQQHKEKIEKDKNINKESVDKKITEVAKIITEHLIEGNEIKLLLDNAEESKELINELKEKTQLVRNQYKSVDKEEIKFIEDKYIIKETDK
jgi:hypothetical protein